jgi:hypothetical protein
MGLFEQNPILLVPFVLVVVVGYDALKWLVRRALSVRAGTADTES